MREWHSQNQSRHRIRRGEKLNILFHSLLSGTIGDLYTGCPVDLLVTYSHHYCSKCQKYFNIDLSDVAPPGGHYTHRVTQIAVRLVVEDGLPYRPASWHLWRDHRVFVPFATIQNWVETGGKKGARADGRCVSELGASGLFGVCCGR